MKCIVNMYVKENEAIQLDLKFKRCPIIGEHMEIVTCENDKKRLYYCKVINVIHYPEIIIHNYSTSKSKIIIDVTVEDLKESI